MSTIVREQANIQLRRDINKMLTDLIEQYKKRANIVEEEYSLIKHYTGTDMPSTFKLLLQTISGYSDSSYPQDATAYQQHGLYLNTKFAKRREAEGKIAAAGGIMDEVVFANKAINYMSEVMVPQAINDGRIQIDFDNINNERVLNIKDFTFSEKDEQVLNRDLKDNILSTIEKSAHNISGTSGMKTLHTLAQITPSIGFFDVGAEKELTDIETRLSWTFHYGTQYKSGVFDTIRIQNKVTSNTLPYQAVFTSKKVTNRFEDIQQAVRNATDQIDFFRINGRVYYTYEILEQIRSTILAYIDQNRWQDLYKFLGGK